MQAECWVIGKAREGRRSFLKKRTKKLFPGASHEASSWHRRRQRSRRAAHLKVFCCFFSKKKRFLLRPSSKYIPNAVQSVCAVNQPDHFLIDAKSGVR
jgi:hypothetical protein